MNVPISISRLLGPARYGLAKTVALPLFRDLFYRLGCCGMFDAGAGRQQHNGLNRNGIGVL
ncbi:MAG: hypothetical protein ABSC19_10220 [Syntrophorhabdales bacterium]